MADPHPKLEVLEGGGDDSAAEAPPRWRNPVAWLLGLLLTLALAALTVESQRTAELSARVQGLSAELSASQTALEAHRRHLDRVRRSVDALDASLAELRSLVVREPAAAEGGSPPE